MAFFNLDEKSLLGSVLSVDTGSVVVSISETLNLRKCQVNQLVVLKSPKPGQNLIGLINRITRKLVDSDINPEHVSQSELESGLVENLMKITLIGTFFEMKGTVANQFRRNLDAVPEIDASCYALEGEMIGKFMSAISAQDKAGTIPLSIGSYTLDDSAKAYINGDKLFQRHAVIVGSTGSGKSWCVAKLVEQIADLPMGNCILFDIHGEYSQPGFKKEGIEHYRIATPGDLVNEDKLSSHILMLPYWLLTYEEMIALMLDRSDSNAPNQAMLFAKSVREKKEEYLTSSTEPELLATFTLDSPVPYKLQEVLDQLNALDTEREAGAKAGTEKNGPFNGKLTRFIQRLEAKLQDKRLGFLFALKEQELQLEWMDLFCSALMKGRSTHGSASVKIIDFSEVPSDILPLVIGLVSRIIFSIQQWSISATRHPIALFCDEAHLYVPERTVADQVAEISLGTFERISKEGRKYGVSLVIISQRPSEVNRTVLSQCNNFLSLRLTNADDQAVIKKLLPDNLTGLTDVLPILDIGEVLVVGDACLLPSRINIDAPSIKPESGTVNFWEAWSKADFDQKIGDAVRSMRKQSKLVSADVN